MTDLTGLLTSGPELIITVFQGGLLNLPESLFRYDGSHHFADHLAFHEVIDHVPGLMGRADVILNSIRSFLDFAEENEELRVQKEYEDITGMTFLMMFTCGYLTLSRSGDSVILRVPAVVRRDVGADDEIYEELLRTIKRFGNDPVPSKVIFEEPRALENVEVSDGLMLSYASGGPAELPEEALDFSFADEYDPSEPLEEPEEDDLPETVEEPVGATEEGQTEMDELFDFFASLEEETEGEFSEEPAPIAEAEPEPVAEEEPVFEPEPAPVLTEREQNVRKNADAALERIRRVFDDMENRTGAKPERSAEPESLSYVRNRRMQTEHYSIDVPDGFSFRENGKGELTVWKPGDDFESPGHSPVLLQENGFLKGESLGQRMSLSRVSVGDGYVFDSYVQLFDGVARFRVEILGRDASRAERTARELLGHIS